LFYFTRKIETYIAYRKGNFREYGNDEFGPSDSKYDVPLIVSEEKSWDYMTG
jgi:hypothetical protein